MLAPGERLQQALKAWLPGGGLEELPGGRMSHGVGCRERIFSAMSVVEYPGSRGKA